MFLDASSKKDRQSPNPFFQIYIAVIVFVESFEH